MPHYAFHLGIYRLAKYMFAGIQSIKSLSTNVIYFLSCETKITFKSRFGVKVCLKETRRCICVITIRYDKVHDKVYSYKDS